MRVQVDVRRNEVMTYIWRKELSGFIDKVVDGTTAMRFMPFSDVLMFGVHGFPFL